MIRQFCPKMFHMPVWSSFKSPGDFEERPMAAHQSSEIKLLVRGIDLWAITHFSSGRRLETVRETAVGYFYQ
jgi:hypothetical protein